MTRLAPNKPIVAVNQRATTAQRWRALHIAMRTVAGARTSDVSGWSVVMRNALRGRGWPTTDPR
jgi:hypothetical protein